MAKAKNEGSLSNLKQKIRSLKRLINKDGLDEKVKESKTSELKSLEEELEKRTQEATINKPEDKKKLKKKEPDYKKVRFTELTKANRKLKQALKKNDEDSIADLKNDIIYITFYPIKKHKYISLYPPTPMEDQETLDLQKRIKEKLTSKYTYEDVEKHQQEKTEKHKAVLEKRQSRKEKPEKIREARLEKKRKLKEVEFNEDDDFFVDDEKNAELKKAKKKEEEIKTGIMHFDDEDVGDFKFDEGFNDEESQSVNDEDKEESVDDSDSSDSEDDNQSSTGDDPSAGNESSSGDDESSDSDD